MKTCRSISVVVLSALFLFIWAAPSNAQPTFFGDFCWSFSADGTSGAMDLGVTDMGNSHFLMSGIFQTDSPSFAQSTINGNAEVLSDGAIHGTLTRSRFESGGMVYSVMHVILDPVTLDGTFDESATFADSSTNLSNIAATTFRTGDIFFISCF